MIHYTTRFPTVSREILAEEMKAAKHHHIPRSYLCDPDAGWIDTPQGRVQFGSPAHFKVHLKNIFNVKCVFFDCPFYY